MKKQILLFVMVYVATASFATIKIVDQNGGGQYTTIQAGINAAVNNDTVLVWPGSYLEQVTLNKNITLMGSGYENTIITGNFTGTVKISNNAVIQWFQVSSLAGVGIAIEGTSTIRNCVIKSCSSHGIHNNSGIVNALVINCIVVNCGYYGIVTGGGGGSLNVVNTISYNNSSTGFFAAYGSGGSTILLSYSNGSIGANSGSSISGQQGIINVDPSFISTTDYHIQSGSSCWDTGHPSQKDPDGTRSDMGYFGGPSCPIYPVVYEITTTPNGNNINIQAKARANY